jgi:ribonuclease-3
MAISNHERVGRGLILLNQGLYPYVKREMQKVYGESWLNETASCLSKEQSRRKPEEILSEDISALLRVMIRHWEKVFKKLNFENRALVGELIEIRNKWAHQPRFSADDSYRAIDTITRLLKAISASEVKIAEQYKQETLFLLSPKSTGKVRKQEKLVEIIQKAKFNNDALLRSALTHRSYVHEHPQEGEHNERLEFLGDALLTYLSGDYLYRRHPEFGEDELTRRRSALVDEKQLSRFALEVGLDLRMRLGRGAIGEGGFQNPNLLSSTFEAVIAAYYIDNNSDIEAVRSVIEPLFDSVPEEIVAFRSNVDSKNQFQAWVQRKITQNPPKYITEQIGGVPHAPEYLSEVFVDNKKYGEGMGKNKKEAEKAAAENALRNLEEEGFL